MLYRKMAKVFNSRCLIHGIVIHCNPIANAKRFPIQDLPELVLLEILIDVARTAVEFIPLVALTCKKFYATYVRGRGVIQYELEQSKLIPHILVEVVNLYRPTLKSEKQEMRKYDFYSPPYLTDADLRRPYYIVFIRGKRFIRQTDDIINCEQIVGKFSVSEHLSIVSGEEFALVPWQSICIICQPDEEPVSVSWNWYSRKVHASAGAYVVPRYHEYDYERYELTSNTVDITKLVPKKDRRRANRNQYKMETRNHLSWNGKSGQSGYRKKFR